MQVHPYYGNMYASITNDDKTAEEFLATLHKDTWSFFNRRYTYIILRAIDPTLAPATNRDYEPNLLLDDGQHFAYTQVLLNDGAEARRTSSKKGWEKVYWDRKKHNERKIKELCTKAE